MEILGISNLIIFFWLIGMVLYFIPSIVAYRRKGVNTLGCFILNFFLGWTLLGWVGALIWAVTMDRPKFPIFPNYNAFKNGQ